MYSLVLTIMVRSLRAACYYAVVATLSGGSVALAATKTLSEQISYPYTVADSRASAHIITSTLLKEQLAISYWYQLGGQYKKEIIAAGLSQDQVVALLSAWLYDLKPSKEVWQGNYYTLRYDWTREPLDIYLELLKSSADEVTVGHLQFVYLASQELTQEILKNNGRALSTNRPAGTVATSGNATPVNNGIASHQAKIAALARLAVLQRAIVQSQQKKPAATLELLRNLDDPLANSLIAYYRAKSLLVLGKSDDAYAAIQPAVINDPSNISLQILLGEILLAQGKRADAIALWESLLDSPSYYSANSYRLAELLSQVERKDLARQALILGVARRPDATKLYELGSTESDPTLAINYLNQALDLRPNYWQAHAALGNIYREQNNLSLAIAAYRTALAIVGDNGELMVALAQCYLDNDQVDMALLYYQQAIRLLPNNRAVRDQLQKLGKK